MATMAMRMVGGPPLEEVDLDAVGSGTPRTRAVRRHVARFRSYRSTCRGEATTRWLWLIATAAYFVGSLFVSEVWFGWAAEEELQPNIDGLSFDEVLLIALVPGIVSVLVTRYVTRRGRHRRPISP